MGNQRYLPLISLCFSSLLLLGYSLAHAIKIDLWGKKMEKSKESEVKRKDLGFEPKIRKLGNGLDVIIIPKRGGSGVSAFYLWVKAGASYESPEFFGGAHVLEHIVFKGSPERGVSEVSDAIERVGGYINAWTSYDETVYWVIIPSEKIDVAIDVLGDIVWNPKFSDEELEREKEVVLEEWRRGEDRPASRLYKQFFQTIYKDYVYGHPVIGYEETIKKVSRELITEFHSKFYSPRNAFVIAVGDFDENEIMEKIRSKFGRVKDKKEKVEIPNYQSLPKFEGLYSFSISGEEKEAILMLGFSGMQFSVTASAYLGIVSEILEKALVKKLRVEDVIANSVDADYWAPKGIGLFGIYATSKAENLEKILNIIVDEIRKIKSLGVSEKDLESAKNSILSNLYGGLQSVGSIARIFGRIYHLTGNLDSIYEYLDIIKRAKPQDLQKFIDEIFDDKRALLGLYVNKEDVKYASIVEDKFKSVSFRSPYSLPFTFVKEYEGIRLYKASNGLRIVLKSVKGTGTISVVAVFPGGQIFYPTEVGTPLLASKTLIRGTKNRTAKMILDEIKEIGGGIGAGADFDSLSVSSSFLAEKREKGLDIFFDILLNPSFPVEEIEKVKSDIIEDLRTRYDNPQVQAFDEFYKFLFPETPYAFPELAKEESIKDRKKEDLEKFWNFINSDPDKVVISIVGDFDYDDMLRLLFLYGEPLFSREKERNIDFQWEFSCNSNAGSKSIYRKGNQVHIVAGFCGPTVTDEMSPVFQVISASVSGMGGRFFMNLREQRGLAYVVAPIRRAHLGVGLFGGYIASAPEKLEEAKNGLIDELNKLDSLTDKEIERGKNLILGTLKRNLQTNSSWAETLASYEFLGFGFDYFAILPEKIKRVSKEDIISALRKYNQMINVVVLGPVE